MDLNINKILFSNSMLKKEMIFLRLNQIQKCKNWDKPELPNIVWHKIDFLNFCLKRQNIIEKTDCINVAYKRLGQKWIQDTYIRKRGLESSCGNSVYLQLMMEW